MIREELLTPFIPDHLEGALRLSQAEGWPHRLEDWALTLSVSEGVVALEEGVVVGTALCSRFGPVATLNMIIVARSWRGRGLGRALMERIIALAGAREMRLVATEDGLPLYRKLGFEPCGTIDQYQGIAAHISDSHACAETPDLATLIARDQSATGMDRSALLTRLTALGTVLAADETAEQGFAILRPFGRGEVLGPLVAPDLACAKTLFAAAVAQSAGRFLRVDLPDQPDLAQLAQEAGLARAGGGTAMRRAGTTDPLPQGGFTTFALVSQALG